MRVNRLGLVTLCAALGACGDNNTPNQEPELASFELTTQEDLAVTRAIDVVDPEGDEVTIAVPDQPANGSVTVTGNSITYTPAANYNGPDLFSVTASDGVNVVTAVVDVTVTALNDPPIGGADSLAAGEDVASIVAAATLLANDSDVDGDTLSITAVGNAQNGTVSITGTDVTFSPAANFVGGGSYEYTLSDGTEAVTVVVSVAIGGENDAPTAVDDTGTTDEDTAVAFAALAGNDTDPEAQTLAVTAVSDPTNGTVVLDAGTATFTPDADFNGTATFNYTVSDGAASDTGTVTITVAPVNDPPTAVDDAATTAEDTAVVLSTLAGNDADIDGPTLTVSAVANVLDGTVALDAGTVTFTPAANFVGTASFTYTVTDGTLTDDATVTITVTAVNDPPVAVGDTGTTDEDTAITFATLTANDSDVEGGALSVLAVANATNGTVVLNGGSAIFTPATNAAGDVAGTFEYTVSDGTDTAVGLVTVTITPVNDAPVAADDTAAVQQGNAITLSHAELLANDSDGGDGAALTLAAVQNAVSGTVTSNANATVTFTPDAVFTGVATFEYLVSDGTVTDVGLVTVTVTPGPVCGDGVIGSPETCDDDNNLAGDGCSDVCQEEAGFDCTGTPSVCASICGDGIAVAGEVCDDSDADETDGCTSQCVAGVICNVTEFPGANRFNVDPATGHCYVGFDGIAELWQAAETACEAIGGHLPAVTTSGENAVVRATSPAADQPWLGGNDFTTEGTFAWITGEPFTFQIFDPGQPDNANGNEDCLHMFNATNSASTSNLVWNDSNCAFSGFVTGRVCEIEVESCGDKIVQSVNGEECDDGNQTPNDGCNALCQTEVGCGNGTVEGTEECDDDNIVGNDGCDSTCQFEGCGNGTIDPNEECDDGNRTPGDNCSATCQVENGCGNGIVEAGEECDDDNLIDDNCSFPTCQVTDGCGDGNLDPGEECDDGNTTTGDTCSSTCTNETLFFSEYVEGSSSNKAIEIRNPSTSTAFDLGTSLCVVNLYSNGAAVASQTLVLTQTIAPDDVLVICHASAGAAILAVCDVQSSATMNFNGDDAVDLVCAGTTLDVFGQIGFDPGTEWGTGLASGLDNTVRRRCGIANGDTIGNDAFDPATEYVGFAQDTFDGLGSPACAP